MASLKDATPRIMEQESQPVPKFYAGDVVQLRSGGPNMSVEGTFGSYDYFKCIYFNQVSGKIEDIMVSDVVLKHANAAPQAPESANQMRNAPVKSSLS